MATVTSVVTHPVYRAEWCITGPPLYGEGEPVIWFGPDTLMACLQAQPALMRALDVA
jgi:hypothetical protein